MTRRSSGNQDLDLGGKLHFLNQERRSLPLGAHGFKQGACHTGREGQHFVQGVRQYQEAVQGRTGRLVGIIHAFYHYRQTIACNFYSRLSTHHVTIVARNVVDVN